MGDNSLYVAPNSLLYHVMPPLLYVFHLFSSHSKANRPVLKT